MLTTCSLFPSFLFLLCDVRLTSSVRLEPLALLKRKFVIRWQEGKKNTLRHGPVLFHGSDNDWNLSSTYLLLRFFCLKKNIPMALPGMTWFIVYLDIHKKAGERSSTPVGALVVCSRIRFEKRERGGFDLCSVKTNGLSSPPLPFTIIYNCFSTVGKWTRTHCQSHMHTQSLPNVDADQEKFFFVIFVTRKGRRGWNLYGIDEAGTWAFEPHSSKGV